MLKPDIPLNEEARLQRLRNLNLLDGPAEAAIDAFTRLAAAVTGKPICLVSLVDAERQWFASAVGCIPQGDEGPRETSFCGHAILSRELMEVEDARVDERFHDNPAVLGDPNIVHYAGMPLVMPGGECIGTLCLADTKPGRLSESERVLLTSLGRMLAGFLVMRERDQAHVKKLEEASLAKSEFLATMSHEIRTPINGVIGLVQILGKRPLPAQEASYVSMIDGCANTLLSLVDDILDFSKIEAGRVSLEWVDTDLQALLREVCDLQRVRAREKNLKFRGDISFDVPRWVRVDPHRLRQILQNLLGNAWKFTEQGGYSLRVETEDAPAGGQFLVFEVQDSGIGIAEEDQHKLFTRFTQADASTTRRFRGTGLGLAIVKQLAQLMGGDVTLDSRAGKGSTFTVRVPLIAGEGSAEPTEDRAAVKADAFADVHVLVVDDNEVNRVVAEGLLRGLGYKNVHLAEDGIQALEVCASRTIDLVLMDCQMPNLDGYAATQELRNRGFAAPVIALTASATSDDRAICLSAGMTGYLTKPIGRDALGEAMHAVLSARVGRDKPAVLVVDDDEINRKVAELMLQQLGFRDLTFARNGQEAFELALSREFGVVLMDCLMPVMDGYETTRKLRAQGYSKPIVALTAGSGDDWQGRCYAAGMDAVVSKPFFIGDLQRAMTKAAGAPARTATEPA